MQDQEWWNSLVTADMSDRRELLLYLLVFAECSRIDLRPKWATILDLLGDVIDCRIDWNAAFNVGERQPFCFQVAPIGADQGCQMCAE